MTIAMASLDTSADSIAVLELPTAPQQAIDKEWVLRDALDADLPFILDTWLESFRISPWAGVIPNHRYKAIYSEAIQGLFSRGAKLLLACNPEQTKQILGWACYEFTKRNEPVLHYVYVKSIYRKFGVAKDILSRAGIFSQPELPQSRFFYTHKTTTMSRLKGGTFEPSIARRKTA